MVSSKSFLATMMLGTALVMILMVGETRAQIPDCASNLVGCASYLNSTKPPESCCKPLRETVATQRECLCSLYNDPNLLQSLRINITQALALTRTCGASADTSLCNNTGTAPAPTTPLTPPPGVAGRDDNSAGKMAWSGGFGLLLLWVSIMAY
ncbi:Bifunctional inhibitor/lipid-transfer protein/seed storage 2S albumin superfamily protein [Thalictrum thalictroides]|uniref:Bifunctional inhibitor/lipid-transfer protein/seed storage 2S albumin superfamily protein n=1 Tax=Thalictrum thalictroides TaxID=46969 RepID=A0A7J6WZ16_THATH|nr:Bifunctional inhibitor/lipid-transfer protein/seed storage 2S albumin superfamily protein [Thalictrum thalictroides]